MTQKQKIHVFSLIYGIFKDICHFYTKFTILVFVGISVLPACMSTCVIPSEGTGSPGTGVTDDCDLPCGC